MTETLRKHVYIAILVAAAVGFYLALRLARKAIGEAEDAGVIRINS